jgi:uncharacterized membrane protein YbhN (UPF0104 family)
VLLTAGVLLAVVQLRGRLPGPASTWAELRTAAPIWLLVATALQIVSMAAFADQQRHLQAAFGVRMPWVSSSLTITYASSAMTTALPSGSAVSAGYSLRQYRARGAAKTAAAAVMVLSSVASVAGVLGQVRPDRQTVSRPRQDRIHRQRQPPARRGPR